MTSVYEFTHALLRAPGASVVKGLRAGGGEDPSLEGVRAEHAAYAAALGEAGLEIALLGPLEDFPDAIFVEDPALVFTGTAILLDPGAPSRQGEVARLAPALEARFDSVLTLGEGHADGGDVLVMPGRAFIGLSARTDRRGAEALARLMGRIGLKASIVETPAEVLHLKTASSLLDGETVLATAALARTGLFADYRVIEVPAGEEHGANVLRVNDRVLAGANAPRVAEALDRHGLKVVQLANSEIAKIDAGFTCMSLRWHAG